MTAEEKFRAGEVSAPAPTPTKLEWTFLAAHRAIDYIHRVTGCLKGETHRLVTLWENNIAEIIRVAASEVQLTPTHFVSHDSLNGPSCNLCGAVMQVKAYRCESCGDETGCSEVQPTDERAEFEKWMIGHMRDERYALRDLRNPDKYDAYIVDHLWAAWRAARVLSGGAKEKKP